MVIWIEPDSHYLSRWPLLNITWMWGRFQSPHILSFGKQSALLLPQVSLLPSIQKKRKNNGIYYLPKKEMEIIYLSVFQDFILQMDEMTWTLYFLSMKDPRSPSRACGQPSATRVPCVHAGPASWLQSDAAAFPTSKFQPFTTTAWWGIFILLMELYLDCHLNSFVLDWNAVEQWLSNLSIHWSHVGGVSKHK